MERITIYQKPTCTTCRKVHAILKEAAVDFDSVNYYIEPLTKSQLKALLKKMGMKAKEVMRTKEPLYKKLRIASRAYTEPQLVDLIVRHPDLLQRPIVEKGDKALLARPAEKIRNIL